MADDPYKVLGVPPTASDEEVQKAYRKLIKKYHPDVNPGDETAERKTREINAAYDMIRNIRDGKASQTYSGQGYSGQGYGGFSWEDIFGQGFGGFGGLNTQEESTELTAARNYINSGHYPEALNVLNSVDAERRNARWYYFSALANYGLGRKIEAMASAEQAVKMEPGNAEYQQLLSRIKGNSEAYRQFGGGSPIVCSTSGICFELCLAFTLCNMCGRPC